MNNTSGKRRGYSIRVDQTGPKNGIRKPKTVTSDLMTNKPSIMGKNVTLIGRTLFGDKTYVADNCIIGYSWSDNAVSQLMATRKIDKDCLSKETLIEAEVWIYPNSVICSGATLKKSVWCDVGSFVGHDSVIGEDSWLHYGGRIYNQAIVGFNCNIGGFVCNRTRIGNNVTMFGSTIHNRYKREEGHVVDNDSSPTIHDDVIIGWNALIIGGITIGKGAYIGANSIITKNIKPGSKVRAGERR